MSPQDKPKATTELRAIPEPLNRASELSHQDEHPGRSLKSSSLVAEVAEELQHLQLPWEQPLQGVADDRDNMSNKEPLHKCCKEDDDAIKGLLMTTPAPEFKGGMWVTREKSHSGLADRLPKPTEPPDKSLLQSRIHIILEEDQEEDSPSFGSCRPLSRVADSGPKTKVNFPLISALLSLKICPHMC